MTNLVYYSQEDPRWAKLLYSNHHDQNQTIAASACGPTSFAMAASSLTGRQVLPPESAQFAIDHGYRTYNNGTAWGFFACAAKAYGLSCRQTGDFDVAKLSLVAGDLVIASMQPGHFTGGGHYILLVGTSGDWIDVYDPNHDNAKYGVDGLVDQGVRNDGKVTARDIVFSREARQFWIMTGEEKTEMNPEDAKKVVAILQAAWQLDMRNAIDTPLDRDEIHRLTDEVRKAGGLQTT